MLVTGDARPIEWIVQLAERLDVPVLCRPERRLTYIEQQLGIHDPLFASTGAARKAL